MSKVAVVTGSAGGLGKGIAERLCKDGYRVVLHDINESMLNKTVSEFKEKNFPVIDVKGDVSKREDQFNLVKGGVNTFGRLDVLVNNAGIDAVSPFWTLQKNSLINYSKLL